MIVKASTFNQFKAIADQVLAALPEDANIEQLIADESIVAELAAENAPSISQERRDLILAESLEALGLIDAASDESIDDQIASVLGAEESYGILAEALTAAGFDTEAILSADSPESAFKAAVAAQIDSSGESAASIATSIASAAGVPAADLPEIDESGEPEADFGTAKDYWAAYKSQPVAERSNWHRKNAHRCPGYSPALSA